MKKKALIALLVVAAIVGRTFIVTSLNQSKARNALADYKAKLRAQGEKLTFIEAGFPFPFETNANLDSIASIVDRLQGKLQTDYIESMRYESPGRAVVIWADSMPVSTNSNSDSAPKWDQLSREMLDATKLLTDLRVELEKPPCYLNWDMTNIFATNWPIKQVSQKRRTAYFLAADCLVALRERQFDRSQANLHALTQLAQVHRADLTLVSAMVRIGVANVGLGVTWQALQADSWDDESLARIQHDWEVVDLISGLENGFMGERIYGEQSFSFLRQANPEERDKFYSNFLGFGVDSSVEGLTRLKEELSKKAAFAFWRSHMEEDEIFFLRDSQARLDTIRRFKTNTSAASLQIEIKAQYDALEKEFDKPLGKYRHLFSARAIPNFSRVFETAVQRETERRMTITAIALKRFQLRNARYPVALAELVPQFLAAELVDPWSGKPLHYCLNADGSFTLYSVGMDGRDNGGDPAPEKPSKDPISMWSGKDAVWPKPVFSKAK